MHLRFNAHTITCTITAIVATLITAAPAHAQGMRNVQIVPVKVSDSIYMLKGSGGNIGISIGEDGVFMIDDQYAPLTGKIIEAIGKLSDKQVKFVVNTHFHGDHTGGNENMGKAGAIIVAHRNVRRRLSPDEFQASMGGRAGNSPKEALPVVTFEDAITFHWNGEDMHVFHVEHAHTDGDSIIHFRRDNAYHMGDVFFNGMYPFIDAASGGSINGIIAAADKVLAGSNRSTRIIPGHGELASKTDLQTYRDMLAAVREEVAKLIEKESSRDQVIAAKPSSKFDAKWGGGFMNPDRFVGGVYDGIMADRKRAANPASRQTQDG